MRTVTVIAQLVIALGIVNVWLVRPAKATRWRPEGASNMAEEFERYGYPDWMWKLVGAAKLALAALLIMGIWYPIVARYAALAMAALMAGAIGSHLRVRDPLAKSLPSFTMLLLSLFVAYANGA